jgi:hypothetical protein
MRRAGSPCVRVVPSKGTTIVLEPSAKCKEIVTFTATHSFLLRPYMNQIL